jgi:hypothetical protein
VKSEKEPKIGLKGGLFHVRSNNDIEYIENRFDTILSNLIENHVPTKIEKGIY